MWQVFAIQTLGNKKFWIGLFVVVAVIALYLFLRRNWEKISKLGQPKYIDYTDDYGNKIEVDNLDKRNIEAVAQEYYDVKQQYFTSHEPTLKKLYEFNDVELELAAKHYKNALTRGESTLYKDIDSSFLPATDLDEKLMTRLRKIGQY